MSQIILMVSSNTVILTPLSVYIIIVQNNSSVITKNTVETELSATVHSLSQQRFSRLSQRTGPNSFVIMPTFLNSLHFKKSKEKK